MKFKKSAEIKAYIPTASMADIAFLLIVLFIISTTIAVDSTPVALPRSMERTDTPEGAAIIAVTFDGLINVTSGDEQSYAIGNIGDIFSFAAVVLGDDPLHSFIIKADSNLRYEIIDSILDQLRDAKAPSVILLTDQETIGGR